jgi:hypothetical protein
MASGIYEKLLNIKKPKCLLVTETAKQHSKLFSTAFQKSDCKVYCFYHGNDTGLKIYKNRHRHVEAHCRYLVVPTKGIARELTKNYIDDKVDKRTGTEYVSVDSIFYENILRQSTRTKRASKVKKVMLLGTPANPNRYVHEHGQFFYIKVDLEYRLIKALKLGGYEVIYKAHPDRLEEVKGLFENVVDEYCTHPFEDVWQKADAFLFTDTASTTFGLSLPTNKHIVLMDNSIDQKNHHVEGLLNKRIRSVSMCLNESMRMKFNNNELYYALNNQFDTIDYSIINEVLL